MNAVLIVDKPSGLTSHDVVNRMRRILQQRAIGHLGTLDPLATGVLPLVTGSFTRLAQFYTASEKSYEGVIRFGFATNTYDADGDPVEESMGTEGKHVGTIRNHAGTIENQAGTLETHVGTIKNHVGTAALGRPTPALSPGSLIPDAPNRAILTLDALNLETLQKLSTEFLGVIQQFPPPFSAKKIHGVPAYKLARKNREVALAPVQVEIKEFTITSLEGALATFRARVSSGTYMRSVAHEMGQRLGCGAHLASLRRTALAEFTLAQSHTLEEIARQINAGNEGEMKNSAKTNEGEIRASGKTSGKTNEADINACHSDRSCAFPKGKRSEVEEPAFPESSSQTSQRNRTRHDEAEDPAPLFIHPRHLLPQFPSITAADATAARIRHGRPVNLPDLSRARHIKVFADQSTLIAIATRIAGTLFHPKIVFP